MKPHLLCLSLAMLLSVTRGVALHPPAVVTIPAGWSSLANPLNHGSNTVAELLADVPDGTVLFRFDNELGAFESTNSFVTGVGWSRPEQILAPGDGAMIYNASGAPFSIAFSGSLALPVYGPAPSFGVTRMTGVRGIFPIGYRDLMGRLPLPGTTLLRFVNPTNDYVTYAYGATNWVPEEPMLNPGEAVFVFGPEDPPPPALQVTGVSSTNVQAGQIITVTGAGFGQVMENVAVNLVDEEHRTVTTRVLGVHDSQITAMITDVPAGFVRGQWVVSTGVSAVGDATLHEEGFVLRDAIQWFSSTDTAVPGPPERWTATGTVGSVFCANSFKSTYLGQGRFKLVVRAWIDPGSHVTVQGGFSLPGPTGPLWHSFRGDSVTMLGNAGTPADWATRFCEVMKRITGVADCQSVPPIAINPLDPAGEFIITMLPNKVILGGQIQVCVNRAGRPLEPTSMMPPLVQSVRTIDARSGLGDTLVLQGTNFGFHPADLRVVFDNGRQLLGAPVTRALDTRLDVALDHVPAGFGTAVVRVSRGAGREAAPQTRIGPPDLDGDEPPDFRIFVGQVTTQEAPVAVTLSPSATIEGGLLRHLYSAPATNGRIDILVDRKAPAGSLLSAKADFELLTLTNGVQASRTHVGVTLPRVVYQPTNGSCAEVLARSFAAALYRASGATSGLPVRCEVLDAGSDPSSLGFSGFGTNGVIESRIERGGVIVSLRQPEPLTPLTIASISPSTVRAGESLTITGTGFGHRPMDLSVTTLAPERAAMLQVVSATDTQLVARVLAGPEQPTPVTLGVTRGVGRPQVLDSEFPEVQPHAPGWVFTSAQTPVAAGTSITVAQELAPGPGDPDRPIQPFCPMAEWRGSLDDTLQARPDNTIVLNLGTGGYGPGTTFTIWGSFQLDPTQLNNTSVQFHSVMLPTGGTGIDFARRVRDTLRLTLGLNMNIQIVVRANGDVTLVMRTPIPNPYFGRGWIRLCIRRTPAVIVFDPSAKSVLWQNDVEFEFVPLLYDDLVHVQWRHNGAVLVGQTDFRLNLRSVTLADAGLYSALVTGPNGSAATFSARLTVSSGDTDNDGMPDAWESALGLNPGDPSDAHQDSDNDGSTNLQEYRAGTDPHNPTSLLRLEPVSFTGGSITFRMQTVRNAVYVLERAATLTEGGSWVPRQTVQGTGGTVILTQPASEAAGYYRLRLDEPPDLDE